MSFVLKNHCCNSDSNINLMVPKIIMLIYLCFRRDYYELFAPRCGACGGPILENFVSALNKQWHPDCFVCRVSGVLMGFYGLF